MPPESIVPALLADEAFRLLLVFVRIGSAMLIMPGLAEAYVAARVRLLLALGLSLALVGPLAPMLPAAPGEPLALARLLAAEAVLGLFIGTTVKVIFAALHIAGTTIAFHAGLATAAIFDRHEATQGTLPGNFLTTTALVLLFVTDAHHLLVQGLAASYATLHPGGALRGRHGGAACAADRSGVRARSAPRRADRAGERAHLPRDGRAQSADADLSGLFIALPLQILAAFATVMLTFAAGLLAFFAFFKDGLASLGVGG